MLEDLGYPIVETSQCDNRVQSSVQSSVQNPVHGPVHSPVQSPAFTVTPQTTLLGCGAPARDVLHMFPLNLPQVGNLECNNMASTNVCRIDSRSSVNLFTAIGLIRNFTS